MVGMAQTAHASTFGGFTVHATGQQSQRSSEQCDDHEDGLSPTHRGQASYFSRVAARKTRLGSELWNRNDEWLNGLGSGSPEYLRASRVLAKWLELSSSRLSRPDGPQIRPVPVAERRLLPQRHIPVRSVFPC